MSWNSNQDRIMFAWLEFIFLQLTFNPRISLTQPAFVEWGEEETRWVTYVWRSHTRMHTNLYFYTYLCLWGLSFTYLPPPNHHSSISDLDPYVNLNPVLTLTPQIGFFSCEDWIKYPHMSNILEILFASRCRRSTCTLILWLALSLHSWLTLQVDFELLARWKKWMSTVATIGKVPTFMLIEDLTY